MDDVSVEESAESWVQREQQLLSSLSSSPVYLSSVATLKALSAFTARDDASTFSLPPSVLFWKMSCLPCGIGVLSGLFAASVFSVVDGTSPSSFVGDCPL